LNEEQGASLVTNPQSEIDTLLGLSARVGRDPLLVQASSGNTSIKLDETLWIKASGKWLARAMEEETLVPVPLLEARARVQRDEAVSIAGASIETAMHAVLPQRVVIHVHSVNTISWAVRRDGAERVAERLAGLNWRWVPYASSGMPLALAIREATAQAPDTNIFILANHGLVICGESCGGAEDLLDEVESRLAVCPRKASAADSVTARILRGGILYPCQAMFLGTQPLILNESRLSQLTDTQRAVLEGLLQVVRRIGESAPIRYLSDTEIRELLENDAHGYLERTERNAVKAAGLKEGVPWAVQAGARAGN
jgi:ribulose-5-phosphate 4-epimerase/fuculose-1-phosphate aldolase